MEVTPASQVDRLRVSTVSCSRVLDTLGESSPSFANLLSLLIVFYGLANFGIGKSMSSCPAMMSVSIRISSSIMKNIPGIIFAKEKKTNGQMKICTMSRQKGKLKD